MEENKVIDEIVETEIDTGNTFLDIAGTAGKYVLAFGLGILAKTGFDKIKEKGLPWGRKSGDKSIEFDEKFNNEEEK